MHIPKNNHPLIMGIVNITPDSFFSQSRKDSLNLFDNIEYKHADIIDIGCESSRPGSIPVCEKDEISRLTQFLDMEHPFQGFLSIDTYKPAVARFALKNGFNMINDIKSGSENGMMLNVAAEYDCPIVLMHMNGVPATMQDNPYCNDIMGDIMSFFDKKLEIAQSLGINRNKIILDPGIGFGKTMEDNDIILNNLNKLKKFDQPILIGLSRKSFLSVNEDGPESRLPATLGATVLAIQKGVDILRVHDIEATYKLKTVLQRINNLKPDNREFLYN